MSRPNPPDFSDQKMGYRLNPDRLTAEAKQLLNASLPTRLNERDRDRFIQATAYAIEHWEQDKPERPLSHSEIVARIEEMESASKVMSRAIAALEGETFDFVTVHYDALIYGSKPPVALPTSIRDERIKFGALLTHTLSTLAALRDIGAYARSKITVSKAVKPGMQSAKSLAYGVARAYVDQFGVRPPVYKDSWFVGYMASLASILKIESKFGPAMLSSVVKHVAPL